LFFLLIFDFFTIFFSLGIISLGSLAVGKNAVAAEVVDQTQSSKTSFYTAYWSIEKFTPTKTNITALEYSSSNTQNNASMTVYICKGQVTSASYNANNCAGNAEIIHQTWTGINGSGNHKLTFSNYAFLNPGDSYYFLLGGTNTSFDNKNTATTTSWLSTNATIGTLSQGYQSYFKTYYEDTITGLEVHIVSPYAGTYTDNSINLIGSTTGATSFEIWTGSAYASPAEFQYGTNIYDARGVAWDFSIQLPNGTSWIWYIASSSQQKYIATTSITIASSNSNTTQGRPASSTMSTTTGAFETLTSASFQCATSAPAFINDPTTFWASNSPAFLTNGSTTATNTPAFYGLITNGIYSFIKPPVDMANTFSCYLSSDMASSKGQAMGVYIAYFFGMISSLNLIFGFPLINLMLIWAVGMALWFTRKLLPFFK